jgi:hypothetical protein
VPRILARATSWERAVVTSIKAGEPDGIINAQPANLVRSRSEKEWDTMQLPLGVCVHPHVSRRAACMKLCVASVHDSAEEVHGP